MSFWFGWASGASNPPLRQGFTELDLSDAEKQTVRPINLEAVLMDLGPVANRCPVMVAVFSRCGPQPSGWHRCFYIGWLITREDTPKATTNWYQTRCVDPQVGHHWVDVWRPMGVTPFLSSFFTCPSPSSKTEFLYCRIRRCSRFVCSFDDDMDGGSQIFALWESADASIYVTRFRSHSSFRW